ncbi:uncharacterized protein [Anabrus simplex]|uniref:uncharacterized protein n=1 Tax=Anabrus simplex TaxID=316456 RepID=UPI0034DD466E
MHSQSRNISIKSSMSSKDDDDVAKASRRQVHTAFGTDCQCSNVRSVEKPPTEKRWNDFSFSNVSVSRIDASRVLRSGANTLSRTFSSVQTTFGTLSQKFRRSTKRRHRLKNESPSSPVTPQSRSRHILGRTPTKLYSPFGIETPKKPRGKENAAEPVKHSPKKRNFIKNHHGHADAVHIQPVSRPKCLYNTHRKFDCEVEEVRVGVWEFSQTAHCIVRRSLRH